MIRLMVNGAPSDPHEKPTPEPDTLEVPVVEPELQPLPFEEIPPLQPIEFPTQEPEPAIVPPPWA